MTIPGFDITGRAERLGACVLVAIMLLVAVIVAPFSSSEIVLMPAFLPVMSTITTITNLLTAYLLVTQWRLLNKSSLAILASGYFFLGMCIIGQTILYQDMTTGAFTLGGTPESTLWMWIAWHSIFPLYVMLYTTVQWRSVVLNSTVAKIIGWGTVFLLIDIYLATTIFSDHLPRLVSDGNNYNALKHSGIGAIVFMLNILSCAYLLVITRVQTRQDLWLSIVLLAYALDVVLTLKGDMFSSLGWAGGRIYSAVGASTLFIVFIHNMTIISRRLQQMNSQLNELALTDALTGLPNRRYFDEKLDSYLRLANRSKEPLSILMIDVDLFKDFNDTYGHPSGDLCLQQTAMALKSQLFRPLDVIARIGGEEFAIILPNTDEIGTRVLAERLLQSVRRLRIPHAKGINSIVTVSIGSSTLSGEETKREAANPLLEAADKALYVAKTAGRNTVSYAPPNVSVS